MFTSAFRMAMTASTSYETEAATYFAAIVTAGSTITTANKAAVNAFIAGCKTDGIWTAIKASCLLAGPDSLAGALVPLVGTAPTNKGGLFVGGDYSRTTGLLGDGTTKALDTNRANNISGQDDQSMSVWLSTFANDNWIGAGRAAAGATVICGTVVRSHAAASGPATASTTGLVGVSRAASGAYTIRKAGANSTQSTTSDGQHADTIKVFNRGSGTTGYDTSYSAAKIAFYHEGTALNLALLDARLTTYMAALT